MPDELVSAYDWTIPLEKEMMENVHSKSQKVLQLYFEQIYSGIHRSTRQTVIFESEHIVSVLLKNVTRWSPSNCDLRNWKFCLNFWRGSVSQETS